MTTSQDRATARTRAIMQATLALAQEAGYTKLSIEAVAARAGVGKHTIYRRWPSKGLLFLDSLLSLNEPVLDYPDTGDIVADLRRQIHAAVDLLANPPWGPLFQALVGEAQYDPMVASGLNERFIRPQEDKTVARLRAAKEHGQISPDLDLDLAMAILSGPPYFKLLITQEPLTHDYVDRLVEVLLAGMKPRT
ncbi:TetR/AcrR family transcriptional regulator [Streptosporangium sp. CA-115845]|uniref:TetR/AcrR family transcriptional regulator n=1 Tax=Streptosporangium sp. CA-115845 TaxID=3240071 RepID=UPI003D93C3F6